MNRENKSTSAAYTVRLALSLVALAVIGSLVGCTSTAGTAVSADVVHADKSAGNDRLAPIKQMYVQGKLTDAMAECIEVARVDPEVPGLDELRAQIASAIIDRRAVSASTRAELAKHEMGVETVEGETLPGTYGVKKEVGESQGDYIPKATPMKQALDKPVSIHVKAADLSSIISALSRDSNINIIADKGLAKGKVIDVELDDVPLKEVLDYVDRNYGVSFHLGKNLIWVTAAGGKGMPFETRVYHLRKGLQFHDSDWAGAATAKKGATSTRKEPAISANATDLAHGVSYIESIIAKFVPMVPGAQLHMDRNTHTLIARNTPANLEMIEDIVRSLDVTPPQVLIEARFVEITLSDLEELGVEWGLGSPWTVTKEVVTEDGMTKRVPRTQVAKGASVNYTPYGSDGSGPYSLGPRGAFGEFREGNPSTVEQGLNFTYQGILTQPMFEAVLHALEISGKGKTLSVPRVTTLNNNPAKLRHGKDLRFYPKFKAQSFTLFDQLSRRYTVSVLIPDGEPEMEELGITLVAVPSVGGDMKTISLMLTPTISKLDTFVSYQDQTLPNEDLNRIRQVVVKLPLIERKEIQTKVIVESGETVVMGGLIDTVEQDVIHRIPILGYMPIIGGLFSRKDVTEERKNLLVFVTATVVSARGESLVPVRK